MIYRQLYGFKKISLFILIIMEVICFSVCNQNFITTDVNITLVFSHYSYLPTPPLGQDMTQGQFLSGI